MPSFDFGNYWQLLLVFFLCTVDAGYKNMLDIRTLYAIPNDVLIIGIHFTLKICIHFLYYYSETTMSEYLDKVFKTFSLKGVTI